MDPVISNLEGYDVLRSCLHSFNYKTTDFVIGYLGKKKTPGQTHIIRGIIYLHTQ